MDAVAQTTKHGYVFLFDRANGKPLFPIEYKKYPASDVDGEVAAETQPLPTKPAPFARQLLTEDLLTNRTPEAHEWALEQFKTFRSEGQFVPLSVGKDTVVFPGFDGGAEWGGSAYDPASGRAVCERQRPGLDRRAGAGAAAGQRPRPVYNAIARLATARIWPEAAKRPASRTLPRA